MNGMPSIHQSINQSIMSTTTPSSDEHTPFSVAFANNDLDDPVPAMVKKGSKTSRNVAFTAMISFTGFATAALMFRQHFNSSVISNIKNDLILNKVDELGRHSETKCVVATGTFNNANSYKDYPISSTTPFETCYQYGNDDKYCWSNSFFDYCGVTQQCHPVDFSDDDSISRWHTIHWYYVNPHGTCGQPCTEFQQL